MELEIAKISPERIRQVSSECRHFLPRKKHLSNRHVKEIEKKFRSITFSSGKFYARIYYILDLDYTKEGTISETSSIWLPEALKIYIDAKNCTDKNVIQYIAKEYKKEAWKYFNDIGGYLFNHMITNTESKELLSAFFSDVKNYEDIPENRSLYSYDEKRICDIVEIFPKDYATNCLWKMDRKFMFNLIKKFPEKFTYVKFLEAIFRDKYDDEYDYILEAFEK